MTWRSFTELATDEALLDAWIGDCGQPQARSEVGGAVTALRVCAPIIDLAVSLLVVHRYALALPADGILLGFDHRGRVTDIALRDAAFAMDDSGCESDASGFPDSGERAAHSHSSSLDSYLAGELVGLLQPVFQALRSRSRYGVRGMWGQAVDEIAAAAMRRARLLGLDQATAWQAAAELTDALAAVEPLIRRRPSAYAAAWPGGRVTLPIKGSCCLYFQVSAHCDVHRYCSTCPLLTDAERAPRLASQLQREHERLRPPQAA